MNRMDRASFRSMLVAVFVLLVAQFGAAQKTAKFRVSGTVVSGTSGQTLADAKVTMGKVQAEDAGQSMTTGEDGAFHFEGLEAGKYWLRAEARGYSQQGFEEHEGFFTGIVTGAEVDTEHLVFQLRPDAVISGEVVDEANEPVRDAFVMLFRRKTEDGREVTSLNGGGNANDEGHYRFGHLLPGTYFIAVRAQPWYAEHGEAQGLVIRQSNSDGQAGAPETGGDRALDVAYPVTYYPGATEESGATPLVVHAGDRVTADVRLNPVPAVHVKLRSPAESSDPVAVNVMERVFDGAEQPAQAQTLRSPEGEFEITGIAPGDYQVTVQRFGKETQTWRIRAALRGDGEITVATPPATVAVKGVVKMEGTEAAWKNGFIQISSRATGQGFTAQISDKGEFNFLGQAVEAGAYDVGVGNIPNLQVSAVSATGAKASGLSVEFGGGTAELVIRLARGSGIVEGTVVREGKGVAGAMVALLPHDVRSSLPLVRQDQSDLDGTFTLRGIVPGKYTVVAIQNGWDVDWKNEQVMSGYLKGGEPVEVVADKKYEVKVGVQ